MLNNLQQKPLKLLQQKRFKKQQNQLVIGLVIKLLIKSQKFQKIYNKIIPRQLQLSTIKSTVKKYLKKGIYPQMKDKKLLMN